jgi:hypothetical protein
VEPSGGIALLLCYQTGQLSQLNDQEGDSYEDSNGHKRIKVVSVLRNN